jgi:hypothetical protein
MTMVTPIVMGIAITATESIGAAKVVATITMTGTDTVTTVVDIITTVAGIVIAMTVGIEWESCNV